MQELEKGIRETRILFSSSPSFNHNCHWSVFLTVPYMTYGSRHVLNTCTSRSIVCPLFMGKPPEDIFFLQAFPHIHLQPICNLGISISNKVFEDATQDVTLEVVGQCFPQVTNCRIIAIFHKWITIVIYKVARLVQVTAISCKPVCCSAAAQLQGFAAVRAWYFKTHRGPRARPETPTCDHPPWTKGGIEIKYPFYPIATWGRAGRERLTERKRLAERD